MVEVEIEMGSDVITISRNDMAAALTEWKKQATSEGWPERDDPGCFDAADYLFDLLSK